MADEDNKSEQIAGTDEDKKSEQIAGTDEDKKSEQTAGTDEDKKSEQIAGTDEDNKSEQTAGTDEDNKSEQTAGTNKDNKGVEEAGQQSVCEKAVSAYACDRETVWALAQMLMPGDRDRVNAWLTKLDGCEDLDGRAHYVKFLMSVAAGGSLRTEPFHQLPPPGPLRRLGEVVDPVVLFGLTLSPSACAARQPEARDTFGPPQIRPTTEAFYARNPIPEDGTICYAAAFSDFCMR